MITFPAVINSGVPWIRIVSCAETEITDPNLPPYLSGCATDDQPGCKKYSTHYAQTITPVQERFSAFLHSYGIEPHQNGEFMETSPWLDLLLAPKILRYPHAHSLDLKKFLFLEDCVPTQEPWKPPRFAAHNDKPLVYTSFGSLGTMDIDLFERMIAVFEQLPYRFIMNVDSWREHYQTTPDNVYLDSWFPQPSVVRHSQLFIQYGGNNSFCEALNFGVPSLIMTFCWDGHDNAQCAQETSVGTRMARYAWRDEELKSAIIGLIEDSAMQQRLQQNSVQMQAAKGAHVAAAAILKVIQ